MSYQNYEMFKESVLDAIHDYMAFHDTPPTRQVAIEDATGFAAGHRYQWLDRMRQEKLIRYTENPNRGMLVTICEEN